MLRVPNGTRKEKPKPPSKQARLGRDNFGVNWLFDNPFNDIRMTI